jgi:hypothetical protein
MGKISFRLYLIAAFLTAVVFSSGILVGWILDSNRVTDVQSQIDDLAINFQNLDLENSIYKAFGNETSACSIYSSKAESLSRQTDQLAQELNSFKQINQFQLSNLDLLKKRYTVMNLQFWLQLVNLKKSCNYNSTTILYFYTTKTCDECVAQGIVLDSLKGKSPEKLMVFAVDSDLNLGVVTLLKTEYNVAKTPTLVINENKKIEGFASQETLEKYL